MNFLAALAEKILEWMVGLAVKAIARWQAMQNAKAEIEKKNQQVLENTENAQTKEERDRAAEEITRTF